MPGPALMDLTMEEPSLGSKWLLEPEALLFKSLLDISKQGFRRKDLTLPNPCSHGFCFPDRKPQLWPAHSPAPVILPLEPVPRLLLRVHWLSPPINLTGYRPPKPFWDREKRRGLGWESKKVFYVSGFSYRQIS